jgi:hypothetical protein
MRHLLLVAASGAPLLLATSLPAAAQPHFGGAGFRHGGFHARSIGVRQFGARPGFGAYRQGWRGGGWGWRHAGYYRGYRGYPYWGTGLAAAATLGAIAAYPYGPVYPGYPVYPVYGAVPAAEGGMCSTRVKTCTLYEPAPIGIGCSCRVPGGSARGTVIGP